MVDTDTIYVDRRNNELLTSIGPYGPCGKRPMSCDSINKRSFRRSREPFISQQRKKKCLSRKNHPYHKCITELDVNDNFIKCSKHDSETRDLPDTVPVSHRIQIESQRPSPQSPKTSPLTLAPPSRTSSRSSFQAPSKSSSKKSVYNIYNPLYETSRQSKSASKTPSKASSKLSSKPSSRKSSKPSSKKQVQSVNQPKDEYYYIEPFNEKNYKKMYMNDVEKEDLLTSIKYYLYNIGVENHPLLQDPLDIRQESRMINKLFTDKNILNLALRYDVCINIWDGKNWNIYGDAINCVIKILLFKEKNRYGYIVRKKSKSPSPVAPVRRSMRIANKTKD